MVRERRAARACTPSARQVLEEARRIADAGQRHDLSPARARARIPRPTVPGREARLTKRSPRQRASANCARARRTSEQPPFTTTASTLARRETRLAQRPRRQQQAVAEAPLAVDHGDLDVARERVVLQAVVAHQHVDLRDARRGARAPRRHGRARCRPARASAARSAPARRRRAPAWPHRDRRAPRRGIVLARWHAPVAARHHARGEAACASAGSTIARVSGVLPVPPTVMLPTTMTGTACPPGRQEAPER